MQDGLMLSQLPIAYIDRIATLEARIAELEAFIYAAQQNAMYTQT